MATGMHTIDLRDIATDAIAHWERRRILYNLVLLAVVVATWWLDVGPEGKVYLAVPTPMEKYSDETKLLPDSLANTELLMQAADALAAPEPVDVVFTAQNYHDYPVDFMGPTDTAVLNKAVYDALKPGGLYIVIDHVAEAGSGLRDVGTLHRIDPALVKQQVEAAGFEYRAESDILRNEADDHTLKVFDPSVRGKTDQFVYRFRKPG